MPNYCNNNLTITGDVKYMKQFYDFVGPLNSNFTMSNLFPIPEEIENTDSPAKFYAERSKDILLMNGKTEKIQINKFNQTEQEFLTYCKYLIEKYGFDNWYDWCLANWGCKWDIDKIRIELQSDEKLGISYETPWCPNVDFITFLWSKFQNLKFELEYYETGDCFAGVIHIKNDIYEEIEIPLHSTIFVKNIEDDYYTFFDYNDEDKMDEWEISQDYEIVNIIGTKWEEAISNADNDYNKENVTNWSAFENFVKIKLNGIKDTN